MTDKDTAVVGEESAANENVVDENPNRAERIDDRDRFASDRKSGKDMRSTIRAAVDAHRDPKEKSEAKSAVAQTKPRDDAGKFTATEQNKGEVEKPAKEAAASPAPVPNPEAKPAGETAPAVAPQAQQPIAAPATAPKEVTAIWDKLPQEAQAVFAKREADMLKGVEKIQSELKPFKDAFAPVMGQLQQLGKTPVDATKQLLAWQAALANPRTQAEAFRALAKAHNFDLATLAAPAPNNGATTNPNPQPQQFDPSIVRQYIDPVLGKVTALETEIQRRDRERVEADIKIFSKDKPHFERVKVAMGHLMQSGLAQGDNPKEIFDDAYARACRADPEVFAMIQQEEQAKRDAEAKAQAEAAAQKAAEEAEAKRKREAEEVARARKAAVGPRSGSPVGMAQAARRSGAAVRDSLRDAIREHSGAV
jgi:hypothetical protein